MIGSSDKKYGICGETQYKRYDKKMFVATDNATITNNARLVMIFSHALGKQTSESGLNASPLPVACMPRGAHAQKEEWTAMSPRGNGSSVPAALAKRFNPWIPCPA